MDLGVLLESPQGSKSSSRMGACTCLFLPSGSSNVMLPVAWFKGSVAFPRGFPTGLSQVPPWWSRTSARKSRQCRENRFLCNGPRFWGTFGMVARRWSSSRLSCGERLLLRSDGNAKNSFPTKPRKDPSTRATRWKQGFSECGRDPRASSRLETGMSRNNLSCSKGVKDLLELPEIRCD